MLLLRALPILLSALLLAAHFMRGGQSLLMLGSLLFPLMLLIPRPWAARVVQCILLLGGIEWLRTLAYLVDARVRAGEPWVRMAAILLAVAFWTAGSLLVFMTPSMKRRFNLQIGAGPDSGLMRDSSSGDSQDDHSFRGS